MTPSYFLAILAASSLVIIATVFICGLLVWSFNEVRKSYLSMWSSGWPRRDGKIRWNDVLLHGFLFAILLACLILIVAIVFQFFGY